MAMGDVIARLSVVLGLDTAAFEEGATIAEKRIAQSAKRIQAFGNRMTDLGQKLTVGLTAPLAALGVKAVQGFVEQERAIADVDAALRSMGGASGKTAAELGKTADALEMRSLFDADVILKQVTANLLTFGNVAGREFDRAQQAAVDMATRLGGEPQAAAIMLGKALNDPAKGITALTRVGVQFTEQQKAQIKAMAAVGDTAGAQGVILAEVEKQFSGAAQAAADATPWRKVQVAIGQAMDAIGGAILPLIGPVTAAIVTVAGAFASLPEPIQKAAVVAGILAAALGPLLAVFGPIVASAAPFLAVVKSIGAASGIFTALQSAVVGLGAAFGPVLAIVAAVAAAGYLIYTNWDKIAPVLTDLWATLQATLGPPLQALVGAVTALFAALWNGPLGEEVRTAAGRFLELGKMMLAALGPAIVTTIKAAAVVIGAVIAQIADAVRLVTAVFQGDWRAAFEAAKRIVDRAFLGLPSFVIGQMQKMVEGVRQWIVGKLGAIWDGVVSKIEVVKGAFFRLYDAVVGHSYVPDMVDGIAAEMGRLDSVMVDKATTATKKTADRFRDLAGKVRAIMDELFPEAAAASARAEKAETIEQGVAQGLISRELGNRAQDKLGYQVDGDPYAISEAETQKGMADALKVTLEGVDIIAGQVGEKMAGIGTSFLDLKELGAAAFQDISRGLADAILGARSFSDALKGVLQNLANMALNAAFKALGTSLGIPAFAKGTNYAPGGLALVGERGPELVDLPRGSRVYTNGQTQGMMRGGDSYRFNVSVNGRMSERERRETGSQVASAAQRKLAATRRTGLGS